MPSKPMSGMCGRRCRRFVALLSLTISTTLSVPARAADEPKSPTIYKWIDEHGIAHYTTDRSRIPRSIRKRIQSVPRANESPAPAPAAEPELIVVPSPPEPELVRPAPALPVPPEMGPEPETTFAPDEPTGTRDEGWATVNVPEVLILEDLPPEQAGLDPKTAKELASLDEEIADLELEITRNEERLLALLAGGVSAAQSDNPELRAIAEDLPQLQADLAVLRERRDSLLAPES